MEVEAILFRPQQRMRRALVSTSDNLHIHGHTSTHKHHTHREVGFFYLQSILPTVQTVQKMKYIFRMSTTLKKKEKILISFSCILYILYIYF